MKPIPLRVVLPAVALVWACAVPAAAQDKKVVVGGVFAKKPATARVVRWGTVVAALPRGHKEVVVGGAKYFVHQGVVYAPGSRDGTFVVVRPPPGIVVTHLPVDYTVVEVGDRSYYYYDDCYYDDGLRVIEVPVGGWIVNLPSGHEAVVVGGERYFQAGGLYFQPAIRGGRTIYIRVDVSPGGAGLERGWERLGAEEVRFRTEEVVIKAGILRGRFRQMRIEVSEGHLEMYDIQVRFANGEIFEPKVRVSFGPGTRSRNIDLPGDQRFIKEVRFLCRSLLGARRATVTIYAR